MEISSKANIEKAFLEFKKATPCDVLVVYFSGHGSTWGKEGDKTNFYYLTKDITSAKLADDAVRKEYAVSDEELTKWLAAIPAQKQVLILDACNSGKAAENLSGIDQRDLNSSQVIAFELLKDRTGTFILTGSAADMVSFEASHGQGLLTYSLLEGISGVALKDGKYVDIMKLFQNSRDVVPKLAASIKQVQIPVIAAPKGGSSFPIGIKDASVKINLPQPKPVVIQCNFQDRDNFNDGLGLTQALNDYFHDQTAKGAQAKFVYYDIPKFAEGFSIRGNYAISGEQVSLAGRLFKGDTPVGGAFNLTGTKDPAVLVKLILKEPAEDFGEIVRFTGSPDDTILWKSSECVVSSCEIIHPVKTPDFQNPVFMPFLRC
ncbi:MAG: caspase family protein [Lewinellaceae bacterium]|nr:caspase family protein [Lewinellaceae bacterium]